MGRIKVLDERLANMIAAGEVVERPASVVKELVENAIDAQATKIEIHVEEGGLQTIRIVDNGLGMDRDDCTAAFERHATSKIRTSRDLFQIKSLGFRGEALASIASVSRVELVSSESSSQVGTRVLIEGGQIQQIADVATVKGTTITVADLFYNTPARLKYMKSIATEIGHISDFVNRLILTHPDIAFTLTHNGKNILQTSGDGKLLHVMAAIYGVQAAKMLLPISGETLDFRWSGFLSKTELTRANRSYLTTLVNGRYIRSYSLANAILRGYHTLLPVGRYPITAIQIEMDPILVDVNVHPAKLEARFSKEDELVAALEKSVQSTLRAGLKIVQPLQAERLHKATVKTAQVTQPQFDLTMNKQQAAYLPPADAMQSMSSTLPVAIPAPSVHSRSFSDGQAIRPEERIASADSPRLREWLVKETVPENVHHVRQAEVSASGQTATVERDIKPSEDIVAPPPEVSPAVPELAPVGQVHGTYIVAQNEQGMYLIDQHAAQERIFYEFFMRKLESESVSSQLMLFPHTVECTVAESEKLHKKLDVLRSLGLDIEWFGNRTFIVRAHPQWFPEGSEADLIEELIQFVLEAGEQEQADIRRMREKAAILMSCKASIKANRYLTQLEMEALLAQLRETTSPFTCPHGRPIIIHFTTYDLEKMFKRVM